MDELSMLG